MDKNLIIVLVVVAVLIIGVMMYQSSQQASQQRDLQLQLASMNNNSGASTNFWDSIGQWGSVISSVQGLFGGGGSDDGTVVDPNVMAVRTSMVNTPDYYNRPTSQQEAATLGMDYLVGDVEGMEFNT